MKKTPIILCAALCAFMPFAKITERNIFNSHKISAVAAVDNAEQQNEGAVTTQSNVTTFGPSISAKLRGIELVEGVDISSDGHILDTGDNNKLYGKNNGRRIRNTTLKKVVFDSYTTSEGTPTYVVDGTNVIDGIQAESIGDGVNMYMPASGEALYILSSEEIVWNHNMSYMFFNCTALETVEFKNLNTSNVTDMAWLFAFDNAITEIRGIEDWDTSNVTDFNNLFRSNKVTRLDVANWDLSSAVDLNSIFALCSQLREFNEPTNGGWDVSNATDLGWIFYDCQSLSVSEMRKLNVEDWTFKQSDFAKEMGGINLQGIFWQCFQITSIQPRGGNSDPGLLDLSGWRAHSFENLESAFGRNPQLTYADLSSWDDEVEAGNAPKLNIKNINNLFDVDVAVNAPTSELQTIVLWETDPVDVESVNGMFKGCANLTTVTNFENWTLGSVKQMDSLFSYCSSLTTVDLSNFETQNLEKASYMFYKCDSLTNITLNSGSSYFETGNVKNFRAMFYGCSQLTELDVSKFETGQALDMNAMFHGCSGLTELDVSNFNTSKVQDFGSMFQACINLESLDVSNFRTANATKMNSMFSNLGKVTTLDVSGFVTSNVTDMSYMFNNCKGLTALNVSRFNTQKVTNMRYMFYGCENVSVLNVGNFITSNVTDMYAMFYKCSKLKTINCSNFNTEKVTTMAHMFVDCSSLKEIDISSFTSRSAGVDTSYMFSGCVAVETINMPTTQFKVLYVDNTSTQMVEDPFSMFYYCKALKTLDVSKLDVSDVTNLSQMFMGCNSITNLDVSNFNTSKCTNMYGMFYNCYNLTKLDMSSFDMTNVTDTTEMLKGDTKLKLIIAPYNLTRSIYIEADPVLYSSRGEACFEINSNNDSTPTEKSVFGTKYTITFIVKNGHGSTTTYYYDYNDDREIDLPTVAADSGYTIKDWTIKTQTTGVEVRIDANNGKLIIPAKASGNIVVEGQQVETMGTLISTWKDKLGAEVPNFDKTTITHVIFTRDKSNITEEDAIKVSDANSSYPVLAYLNNNKLYFYCEYDIYVNNASSLFFEFTGLQSVDLSTINTSKSTSFSCMFYKCGQLTEIIGLRKSDLEKKLDTSRATSMNSMFYDCSALTNLDITRFNTSNVTDMYAMFHGCSELTELDVTNFNTSNVTNMGYMFFGCSGLTELDVTGFNTSNVTNMYAMFHSCSGLTELDVTGFNTSNVTSMGDMFYGCKNLTKLDLSKFDMTKVVEDRDREENLTTSLRNGMLNFSLPSTDPNLKELFLPYNVQEEITVASNLNLYVYNADSQEYERLTVITSDNCAEEGVAIKAANIYTITFVIKYLVLEGDGIEDERQEEVIYQYSSSEEQDITLVEEGKDFHKFAVVTNPTSGDVEAKETGISISAKTYGNFTVSVAERHKYGYLKGNDFKNYFKDEGATSFINTTITTIKFTNDLSSFEGIEPVQTGEQTNDYSLYSTDYSYPVELYKAGDCLIVFCEQKIVARAEMAAMFNNFQVVQEIDLSNLLITNKTTGYGSLFYNCKQLTTITNFEELLNAKPTTMSQMFYMCEKLTTIDLKGLDTSATTDMYAMFAGCKALTSLDVSGFNTSNVTNMGYMFNSCIALEGLYIGNFDMSKVVEVNPSWLTTQNTVQDYMFGNMGALRILELPKGITSNNVRMYDSDIGGYKEAKLHIKLRVPLYINLDLSEETVLEGDVVNLSTLNSLVEGAEDGTFYKNTESNEVFKYVNDSWVYVATMLPDSSTKVKIEYLTCANCSNEAQIIRADNYFYITFNRNEGIGGTPNKAVATSNENFLYKVTSIEIPTRVGYSFEGYFDALEGGTKYFNADGSYAFSYWYEATDETTGETTGGYQPLWTLEKDVELFAHWTKKEYDITIAQPENGTATISIDGNDVTSGKVVYGETYTITVTKTGYQLQNIEVNFNNGVAEDNKIITDGQIEITFTAETTEILVTPHFTAKSYTITYDKNGGTGGVDATTVNYNGEVASVTIPTRAGYVFEGYYDKDDETVQYFDEAGEFVNTVWQEDKNVEVKAQWRQETYRLTLEFNPEMGNVTADKTSVHIGDVVTLTISATSNYQFAKWVLENSSQGTIAWNSDEQKYQLTVNDAGNNDEEIILNATFALKRMDVSFINGEGAVGGPENFKIEYGAAVQDISTPTKNGYIFLGYYNGTTQYYDKEGKFVKAETWNNTYSIELTAKWATASYTIEVLSENIEMGSAYTGVATVNVDEEFEISYSENDGYEFIGWEISPNTEEISESEGSYTLRVKGGEYSKITITAKFKAKTYSVDFNDDGGTGGAESFTIDFAETVMSLEEEYIPEKAGYTFLGYFDDMDVMYFDAAGETQFETWEYFETDSLTLTAHWEIEEYGVVLNADSSKGSIIGQTTVEANGTYRIEATVEPGYTFTGWNVVGNNCSIEDPTSAITNLIVGDAGDAGAEITVTANFEANKYTITLHKNDGTEETETLSDVEFNQPVIEITKPIRVGYTFKGYYDDVEGGEEYFNEDGVFIKDSVWNEANDKDLYAQWEAKEFVVSYNANGGSGEMSDSTFTYDEVNALTANEFTKAGYTFVGWALTTDGSKEYDDEANTENHLFNDGNGATLYAVWVQEVYKLVINGTERDVVFGDEIDLNYDSVSEGKKFDSWVIDTDFNCVIADSRAKETTITIGDAGETGTRIVIMVSEENEIYKLALSSGTEGTAEITDMYDELVANLNEIPFGSSYKIKAEVTEAGYEFSHWEVSGASVDSREALETTITITDAGEDGDEVTVRAVFKACEYEIIFNNGLGSGETSKSVTFNEEVTNVTIPTREGYSFKGYYLGSKIYFDENGAFAKVNESSGDKETTWLSTENVTLTANWEIEEYNISVSTEGNGSATITIGTDVSNGTVVFGEEYNLKAEAEEGYVFDSWEIVSGVACEIDDMSSATTTITIGDVGEDISIKAVFKEKVYTLEVSAQTGGSATVNIGGEEKSTGEVEFDVEYTVKAVAESGYVFAGWEVDSDFNCVIADSDAEETTITIGDAGNSGLTITVTAKFNKKSYNIVYEADPVGCGSISGEISVEADGDCEIEAVPETGYEFNGWEFVQGGDWCGISDLNSATASLTVGLDGDNGSTIKIKAKFKASEFVVSYNANGGLGEMSDSTFTYDEFNTLTANEFTKEGYTFVGWALTTDGSKEYDNEANTENYLFNDGNGATLYAVWEIKKCSLTFNYSNNEGEPSASKSSEVEYGETVELAANPKQGYVFVSWEIITGADYCSIENLTSETTRLTVGDMDQDGATFEIKANYDAREYIVNYEADSSKGMVSGQATVGANGTYRIEATVEPGYKFTSWSVVGNNCSIEDPNSAITNLIVGDAGDAGAEITVTANFEACEYTITLHKNDGTNEFADLEVTYNVKPEAEKPTREGYTFLGYFDADVGGNKYFNENGTFVKAAAWNEANDKDLYAQWEANKYTITLHKNDGTNELVDLEVTYNVKPEAEKPTREGYTFLGYFDAAVGGTQYFNEDGEFIKDSVWNEANDKDLYAQWEACEYEITFDNGLGSGETSKSVTFNEEVTNVTIPTREGYTFKGYYLGSKIYFDENGAFAKVNESSGDKETKWLSTENVTLTANWEIEEYEVVLDADSSKGSIIGQTTVEANGTYRIEATVEPGYKFTSWSVVGNNCSIEDPNSAITNLIVGDAGEAGAEITVTANFEACEYEIAFDNGLGSGETSKSVTFNAEVTNVTIPTREGYTFLGYFDADVGGNKYFNENGTFVKAAAWNEANDKDLYAQWEAKEFVVSYNANGGSGEMSDSTFTYDEVNTLTANEFTKAGYTFVGWARTQQTDFAYDANATVEFSNGAQTNNGLYEANVTNVNLYAVWKQEAYNIATNYNSQQGEVTVAKTNNVVYNEEISITATVSSGYSFEKWLIVGASIDNDKSKDATITISDAGVTGATITVTAIFKAEKYNVKLHKNDTTNSFVDLEVTYNVKPVTEKPTRTGYSFLGYFDAAVGGTQYFNENGSFVKATGWNETTENKDLYAQWEAKEFVVSYNANGGSGTMSASTFTYDAADNILRTNSFTKAGWHLIGWALTASGAKEYDNEANTENHLFNEGLGATLFAVWEESNYTLTLYMNDGSENSATLDVTYDVKPTVEKPFKPGYKFLGYFDAAVGGTKYFNENGTFVKAAAWNEANNKDLYAQWQASTYIVSFNNNGGTGASAIEVVYGEVVDDLTVIPTREGYNFAGYYSSTIQFFNETGKFTKFSSGKWEHTSGYNLIAKWEAKEYSVTFNYDGGTDKSGAEAEMTYSVSEDLQTLELPIAEKEGYEFNGWCVDELSNNIGVYVTTKDGKYFLNIPVNSFGEVTLKAKFWHSLGVISKDWKNSLTEAQISAATSINFVSSKIIGSASSTVAQSMQYNSTAASTINLNSYTGINIGAAGVEGGDWLEDSGSYPVQVYVVNNAIYIYCEKEIYFPVDSSEMFKGFSSVRQIKFGTNINTSEVQNMSRFFEGCVSVTDLSLQNFDTTNVTNMSYMFFESSSAVVANSIYLTTANVTDMKYMFALKEENKLQNVKIIDISTFNTSKVTDVTSMFENRSKLETVYIDETLWSVANVTQGENMFKNCASLKGSNGTKWTDLYIQNGNKDPGFECAGVGGVLTQKPSGDSAPIEKKPNYMLWITVGGSVVGALLLAFISFGMIRKTKKLPQISSTAEEAIKELDDAEAKHDNDNNSNSGTNK